MTEPHAPQHPGPDPAEAGDAQLRRAEAEDMVRAIGAGEVDAFVLSDAETGRRVVALETADRPYRMFVENMRDGAATISSTGLILFANARLAELLSCAPDTILGASLARFLPGDGPIDVDELRGPDGRGVTVEIDLLDGDGRPVPVLIGSSPLTVGDHDLMCLTFSDLRLRKSHERQIARLDAAQVEKRMQLEDAQGDQVWARARLVESEERLQAILDDAPVIVHVKDLDGRYVFINRQCELAFGVERTDLIGHLDTELWPEGEALSSHAEDLEVLRSGEPRQSERVVVQPDGEHVYLSASFLLCDANGLAYGISGIWTDITERKQAERERRSLEDRLQRSDRLDSLGQLAGGVAHDFNNLLAVILAYAGFAAERTTGEARDDIEQISAAAERAVRLTRQLLILGHRETINAEQLDLNAIVGEIGELLGSTIGEHIELLVRTDESLPAIHADRGQIDQILVNLAVNARDAMPDGGTLTIETRGVDHDPLETGTPPGRHVQLSVSDTGLGMSAEVVAHAFEPFFTTKPKGQGTGLGLATVYGIVTRSGGTVTVHSEEGLGTTFRIRLPSTSGPAAPVADEAAIPARKGHGETILVVEDEPALLATTTRTLRQHGYHVLSAASGEAALVLAAHNDVHLLLTDLVMPKMSGSALTKALTAVRPHLAVLFMSGYSEDVLDRQRLHHGDIALIQKPFTRPGLLGMVDAALPARTVQDTARS